MMTIDDRIKMAMDLLQPEKGLLQVSVKIVDGFDPEDEETTMSTSTDMSTSSIIVSIFRGALVKYRRNPYGSLKHEYIHVGQIQDLYAKGGWKLVHAANAYEIVKWNYEDRPSEVEAYSYGREITRTDFLKYFETEEFKKFFSIIDTYDDEGVTFKGECSIVVYK